MTPDEPVPRRRVYDHVKDAPHISDNSAETARDLKRSLRILVVATVVLYLALGIFVWITREDSNKQQRALCVFRKDAITRLHEGTKFLREHPKGVNGISAAEIRRSLDGYSVTIAALSNIHCPPDQP